MKKAKKFLLTALGMVAVVGVALKISRKTDYNTVISYLFLIGGLLLLAVEITNKAIRKPWLRIVLLLIPALIVTQAVQNLLTNTYSSSIVISLGMYFLLSERYVLTPKKS